MGGSANFWGKFLPPYIRAYHYAVVHPTLSIIYILWNTTDCISRENFRHQRIDPVHIESPDDSIIYLQHPLIQVHGYIICCLFYVSICPNIGYSSRPRGMECCSECMRAARVQQGSAVFSVIHTQGWICGRRSTT